MSTLPRLHVIDLEYLGQRGSIASYVIETADGLLMIESGPASCIDVLQAGLRELGADLGDVKHLLLSHIHFDHAGAAGHIAEAGATVHVHRVGAPHLADPSKLIASATRIYGDDMDRLWGEIRAVPGDRLVACSDGARVSLGGVDFRAIETPGHAAHHHTWACDLRGESLGFTGDAAAAVCLEAPDFISLPAPPPEFDPDAWRASIERIRTERFDAILPTHFGRIDDVDGHLDRVRASLDAHVEKLESLAAATDGDDAAIVEAYGTWIDGLADDAGLPDAPRAFYAKGSVVTMNVSGFARWRRKRLEAASG